MDPIGGLVISDEVLAEIAVTAARDVPGVSALVRQRAERLPRLDSALHFVKMTGEGELVVELWLRMKPGTKITAAAADVQRSVKEALHTMTGKTVSRVNLRIIGIDY